MVSSDCKELRSMCSTLRDKVHNGGAVDFRTAAMNFVSPHHIFCVHILI